MDINTDCGCGRPMALDMALGSSPGPDNTMALGGSADDSDLYGPGSSMVLNTNIAQCGASWRAPVITQITQGVETGFQIPHGFTQQIHIERMISPAPGGLKA
ncbi:hypothetical protein STEG23_035917 [Scotinomys teguina]